MDTRPWSMLFVSTDIISHTIISTIFPPLGNSFHCGLEIDLMHLSCSFRLFRDDLLRFAVQSWFPKEEGGFNGPCTMIDSINIVRTERLTDIADYLPQT